MAGNAMRGWGLVMAALAWCDSSLWAQGAATVRSGGMGLDPAGTATVAARLTAVAPIIDGRDDDAIWSAAEAITQFRQEQPTEGATPTFPTRALVAYDARNLYVFLRAFDPHPDSIVAFMARRDMSTQSDYVGVMLDPYHDRRTGYEFYVNPAGVKNDWAIRNDSDEDHAWDAVWEVATRVDSLGWTAEFRIPLSQMRYRAAASDTFGISFSRNVKRLEEHSSWPGRRLTLPGLASQFGDLTGLTSLAPPRRVELMPYLVSKYLAPPLGGGPTGARATLGGDLKYAIASNATLNATINPDFGQVEADPAVLNLSTVETFFPEQRPFFVEGAGLYNVTLNCGLYSCPNETLFYSRRIGRAPQLSGVYGDAGSPGVTRILGAAKLSGRARGLNYGVLGAATERVGGVADTTIEPGARYGVLRVSQDLRHGESGIGVLLTGVTRDLDAASRPFLHHNAYAAGVDFRHRFLRQFVIHGSANWSRISGDRNAITATQTDPVHNYQRPDGALRVDSTRTTLSGDDQTLAFDKLGGVVHFQAIYTRRSPGFDVNDLGYLRLADQQTGYGWLGLEYTRPTRHYRRVAWNFNSWLVESTAGLVTDRGFNSNLHWTFPNRLTLGAWIAWSGLGATFCDRCARGGPALRQDVLTSTWFNLAGDDRHRLTPSLTVTTTSTDAGRSTSLGINPQLALNASTRLSAALGVNFTRSDNNTQWFGNPVDSLGVSHYTFARLEQRTLSLTASAGYAATTTLSIQAYLQPFVSWGTYSAVRELAAPRAAAYDDRFRPYTVAGGPGGIESKQLNGNLVIRWEYRPGSALFLVWTQARQGFSDVAASRSGPGQLAGVFGLPSNNTFLIKLSYWFSR